MTTRRLTAALAGAGAILAAGALALALVPLATASGGPVLPTSDPFYSYSGSLAKVAPGTVLRRRTITVAEAGSRPRSPRRRSRTGRPANSGSRRRRSRP